jgi:AcrR family transcriptional regulator
MAVSARVVGGRAAERAGERVAAQVRDAQAKAAAEARAFIEAGLEVMRRTGAQRLTVADVLAEAHRSTRAFYRHFASKDELLLAIYEHERQGSIGELRDHIAAAPSARDALLAWVDSTLDLAYDGRRARRTRVLAAEAKRLQGEHPEAFAEIASDQLQPLVDVLARGHADGTFPNADPERDARTVHSVVWSLVEDELLAPGSIPRADARAHALRFCLPALGATTDE